MEGMRLIVGEDLARDKYTQAPSARFPGSLVECKRATQLNDLFPI